MIKVAGGRKIIIWTNLPFSNFIPLLGWQKKVDHTLTKMWSYNHDNFWKLWWKQKHPRFPHFHTNFQEVYEIIPYNFKVPLNFSILFRCDWLGKRISCLIYFLHKNIYFFGESTFTTRNRKNIVIFFVFTLIHQLPFIYCNGFCLFNWNWT